MVVDEKVVVAKYNSLLEAEIAKNILACAGIPSHIECSEKRALHTYGEKVRIVVRAELRDEARTLLRIRE